MAEWEAATLKLPLPDKLEEFIGLATREEVKGLAEAAKELAELRSLIAARVSQGASLTSAIFESAHVLHQLISDLVSTDASAILLRPALPKDYLRGFSITDAIEQLSQSVHDGTDPYRPRHSDSSVVSGFVFGFSVSTIADMYALYKALSGVFTGFSDAWNSIGDTIGAFNPGLFPDRDTVNMVDSMPYRQGIPPDWIRASDILGLIHPAFEGSFRNIQNAITGFTGVSETQALHNSLVETSVGYWNRVERALVQIEQFLEVASSLQSLEDIANMQLSMLWVPPPSDQYIEANGANGGGGIPRFIDEIITATNRPGIRDASGNLISEARYFIGLVFMFGYPDLNVGAFRNSMAAIEEVLVNPSRQPQ